MLLFLCVTMNFCVHYTRLTATEPEMVVLLNCHHLFEVQSKVRGPVKCWYKYRGGISAMATTAMTVPIVKQNVGVVNVEALKRAWHSIS